MRHTFPSLLLHIGSIFHLILSTSTYTYTYAGPRRLTTFGQTPSSLLICSDKSSAAGDDPLVEKQRRTVTKTKRKAKGEIATSKGRASRSVRGSKATDQNLASPKSKKAAPPKKARKKKANAGPSHWVNITDPFKLEYNDGGEVSLVGFKVRGNPRPLVRHRTGRGFMYNPSAGLQVAFREAVEAIVFTEESGEKAPLFNENDCLVMTILFSLKRPMKHFVGNKAGAGRMKENAPSQISQTRTDVDNLTKFVLDSLNEVLYPDDKQIISVHVIKVLDDDDMCRGSTEVCLRAIDESKLGTLISNSFNIVDE